MGHRVALAGHACGSPRRSSRNPSGRRATSQPVSLLSVAPGATRWTSHSFGVPVQVGRTSSRSTLPPMVRSVNANCSTASSRSFWMRTFSSSPVFDVDPDLLGVTIAVLRFERVRLGVEPRDARRLGLAHVVLFAERLALLRRQRGERVAERARLDAQDLVVRVIAADLVLAADHLARGSIQVDELLGFDAVLVAMDQARGLRPVAVLVDDRADVVERPCRLRRAGQPGCRIRRAPMGRLCASAGDEPAASASNSTTTGASGRRRAAASAIPCPVS